MLRRLKDLVQVDKKEPVTEDDSKPIVLDENERKRTYHESGHRESTRNFGGKIALSVALKAIYAKFQNEEKENESKQKKYNEPYLLEKSEKETEIKTKTVVLDNLKEKRENRVEKVESIKNEIVDIPNNPEKHGIDAKKGASVKFWIGVVLLVPITLYLITFYVSTSYSAFFKEFGFGDGVLKSILDANAFSKSWKDGPLEGMFVTFIPFVFMGLGFLIHMFGEKKNFTNSMKIVILFLVTFIFDAILAYLIEAKLFVLDANIDSGDFSFSLAFKEPEFWGIIFAGFLVYIIWGLVFDFIMKEHKEKDKISIAIRERRGKMKIEKEGVEELDNKLHDLKENIQSIKGKIDELNRRINAVIIPVKEYQLYASEYMQGWITSISENLHGSALKKEELTINCNKIYMLHVEEVGSNLEVQNKIFISQP